MATPNSALSSLSLTHLIFSSSKEREVGDGTSILSIAHIYPNAMFGWNENKDNEK